MDIHEVKREEKHLDIYVYVYYIRYSTRVDRT